MAGKNGAIKLVAGNSNPRLAEAIAAYLKMPLAKAVVRRFADMEIFVEILENVRGADVFVLQSTSYPANDHMMELLIIMDALRRSSARRITAVVPYFGYARQDRKPGPRTPISAKLVANLITRAGADRVLTLDLHAGQIQGFFDIPTDNLYASPVMVRDIREHFDVSKVMVVSPDVGGVVRARGLAKRINAPLAIIDKRRERAGESEVMNVIGEVEGRTCILVDDIVDSGGTLVNAADALLEKGATAVSAYITHGVLSGGAVARITASRLQELVITDSIQPTEAVRVAGNIRVLSIATLRMRRQLEQRRQPRHHEHAGGHHGGGMDQRGDRRRAFHGVGQPGVQQELRRLAHRAHEQQQADQRERVRLPAEGWNGLARQRRRLREHGVEIDRADQHEQRKDAEPEAEVADPVDDEGLDRRRIGFRLVIPDPDQQIARQTDAFPAEIELHQVVGGHQHQHEEGENRQVGEETRPVRVLLHVADGIKMHEAGYRRHHHQHHRGERVDAQRPVHL